MVMVSAVAMAYVVNASSFVWGFMNEGDYINSKGDAFDSGTAFLFIGAVTASESAFDLSGATYVTSAGYVDDYFGATSSENMAASDKVTSTAANQDFSLLLFDQEGMTLSDLATFEGDYVLYTGKSEEGSIPGVTVTKYGKFLRYGEVEQSSWATMGPVPEPTSGLLLLLGMAGLALKRKRA